MTYTWDIMQIVLSIKHQIFRVVKDKLALRMSFHWNQQFFILHVRLIKRTPSFQNHCRWRYSDKYIYLREGMSLITYWLHLIHIKRISHHLDFSVVHETWGLLVQGASGIPISVFPMIHNLKYFLSFILIFQLSCIQILNYPLELCIISW